MSTDSDSGWGCAILLLGMIFICVYPFYDGYATRDLPENEARLVEIRTLIENQYVGHRLYVSISNKSNWVLDVQGATLKLTSASGALVVSAPTEFLENPRLKLAPGEFAGGYFKIADSAGHALHSNGDLKATIVIKGHRRPIRLVKEIVDRVSAGASWVGSLFERT